MKREIGHLHRDRIADLPVTPEIREALLAKGRAHPHRADLKGYGRYPLQNPEDVSIVIEVLGRNYAHAKTDTESVARSHAESHKGSENEA